MTTKPNRVEYVYRKHEIAAWREESLGGFDLLYYSIFRVSDGYECTSGFTYDESTPEVFAKLLEGRIDEELKDADPWGEASELI